MKQQPRSSPRSGKTHRTVSIIGTGSYVPERILTNDDLSRIVDARELAGPGDLICVTGSLFVVAAAREALGIPLEKD